MFVACLFCNSCHHVTAAASLFCSSCHHIVVAKTLSLSLNSCHHVMVTCSSCHYVVAFCSFRQHVTAIAYLFCNSCHHVTAICSSFHQAVFVACLFCNSCHHVTAIFWPEFPVVWLPKMPASGWGSLWESSIFVPWFLLNAFRDITGVVPDLPWISEFMRKSSFTWVKWVGNVSLYRNYPQNIMSIRMYSLLYPESNF